MYRNGIRLGFRVLCVAGLLALTASSGLAQAPSRAESGQPGYYTEDYPGSPEPKTDQKLPARIRVRLPADAELLINGKKTTSIGPVREFETPNLDPDRVYPYLLLARWTENGIAVEKRLKVRALSGNRVTVNFVPMAQERSRPLVVRVTPSNGTAALPPLAAPVTNWRSPTEIAGPQAR